MYLKNIQSVLILVAVFQGIYCQNDFINCTFSDPYNYRCELMINNTQGSNDFENISGSHIENQTDNDVHYLGCQYNIISTNVPSVICQKFKNIFDMQFYYVGIERIDSYSFKGCENLLNLHLFYNQIATIDEQAFASNHKLQYLDLSQNRISALPENLFMNQQNLIQLNFYSNQLFDIPGNVFKPLTNLTHLFLSENYMKNINPEWFTTLESLIHLDLSNSNLTEELPRNLFGSLKKINYIGFRSSKIRVLHADTFGESLSIQNLDLGSNRIYAMDERFIDNTGPTYFDIYGNICVDVSISDSSMTRKDMKEALKDCFLFYKMLIENNPSLTESSVQSTTSSGLNGKIQTIEDEVKNLTKINEEIIENWKIQYVATADNKEQIAKLQALSIDLKNEMQEIKGSIDEVNGKIEGVEIILLMELIDDFVLNVNT
ncbi:hypothetical protein ACKWTF_001491 [Chironomus riparius]